MKKSRIFESCSRPWSRCFPLHFHISAYTAHQGGLVLMWYCPGGLVKASDPGGGMCIGEKGFHMSRRVHTGNGG